MIKKTPYRKFIILSSPRSGTHMIRTTLRNHPGIVAHTELFNPDFLKDEPFDANTSEDIILNEHIFCDYPPHVETVGFIIHRSGTPWGDWPKLWNMLIEDKDIFVISLRRRNLLRRYLSYQVMRTFKGAPPSPLTFDPEVLKSDFEYQQKEIDLFDQRFSEHPLIKVYYEDLCENYRHTVKSVLKFLKVKSRKLWPDIEGRPIRKLEEAIANYEELKVYFQETEWAPFFNEREKPRHISKPFYKRMIEKSHWINKLLKG